MRELKTKRADVVANVVEMAWFTRNPWPTQIVLDWGTEFMGEFSVMINRDYGLKKKPITTRNPQANAIIERLHQTLGNMLRTFEVHNAELDESDPWSGILAAVMFAIRSTVHTTLLASPAQLVFGRDAILNIKFDANWRLIKEQKQKIIKKNNVRENSLRRSHTYVEGDRVLVKTAQPTKYGTSPYEGPYTIIQVNDNGTIRYRKRALTDTINIRNVHPYTESTAT
jgi:transposase InsO family protein